MGEYTVYDDLTYDCTDGEDRWRGTMKDIIAELDPVADGLQEDDVYLVRIEEGVAKVYTWIGDTTPFIFATEAVAD